MNDDFDNIFLRPNLQQLWAFLLHGEENMDSEPKDYSQRIDEAWQFLEASLKKHIPDQKLCEAQTNIIHHYASAVRDVYMEIGLRCGVMLAAELL